MLQRLRRLAQRAGSGLAALLLFSWLTSGYQACVYAAGAPSSGGPVVGQTMDPDACAAHSAKGDGHGSSALGCPDCWESGCPALMNLLAHGMGDPWAIPSPSQDSMLLGADGGTSTLRRVACDSPQPLPFPPVERHPIERFCVLLN